MTPKGMASSRFSFGFVVNPDNSFLNRTVKIVEFTKTASDERQPNS